MLRPLPILFALAAALSPSPTRAGLPPTLIKTAAFLTRLGFLPTTPSPER